MSVRENAAVSTLKMFSKFGIVQRRPEFLAVNRETESLALKARSLEANILSLSGGNQQKVLFSRALINQNMQVLLANEPTQGVDVGARAEIYRTLRRVAAGGVAVIMVSSDVRELSGLCDRVVVMSSGRQVGEFVGEDVTEETITRAILTSTVRREGGELASASGAKRGWLGVVKRLGKGDFGAPIVLVVIMAIVSILTANHDGRFLATYNLNNLALLIAGLGFVAVGEAFVILTGGIDLSVGPLVGLVAVIGSFFETNSRNVGSMVLGFVIMLAACAAVGLVNGLFVQSGLFTPIAATLVTYTGIQGVSLLIRPFQAGYISYSVMSVVNSGAFHIPYAFIILVVIAFILEYGLHRRKWGRELRAVGSDALVAFRLGARPNFAVVRAYVVCSLFCCLGGIMLMGEIGVGDATQGINFTLSAITAVVLAGTSVFGGRGSFLGVLMGSLLLEEILDVTVFLNLSEAYEFWFQALLIFVAVGIYAYTRKRSAAGPSGRGRRVRALRANLALNPRVSADS
jgi:ribose transport system ATP-binding protein